MIEASRGAGIPVLAGGRGFGADGRWAYALGANGWAPDPAAALTLIEGDSWTSYTDPPPPLRHPDEAHVQVRDQRGLLVEQALKELTRRFPPVLDYDEEKHHRTVEDLGHILDFLATALYLDDVSLFTDFVEWLRQILAARGVPPAAVDLGLDAIDVAVPYAMRRAHEFIGLGRRSSAPDERRN
jgi:hypothetical protein